MEQQISIVTLVADTKKLIHTLRQVEAAVGKRSKKAISVSAEITVTNEKITFAVPGAIFSTKCITQGTCKASVPFLHVFQIIKDFKSKNTEIAIYKESLKINGVTISVRTTFFEDDNILKTIDLPINYTDGDLIRLYDSGGYTYDEIEFNNLQSKIDLALENLDINFGKAYELLEQYGVDYRELKEMLYSKLFSKT